MGFLSNFFKVKRRKCKTCGAELPEYYNEFSETNDYYNTCDECKLKEHAKYMEENFPNGRIYDDISMDVEDEQVRKDFEEYIKRIENNKRNRHK